MPRALFLICGAYFLGAPIASALPFWNPGDLTVLVQRVGATDCRGPIASEGHPILDSKLIAKLRRDGKLPDKFVCGRCQYDLRGDPGAAYYVKTCR
jgi:hypothetical protein